MNTATLTRICDDYDVETRDLQTAALAQLMRKHSMNDDGKSREGLINTLSSILSDRQLVAAVNWAAFMKRARTKGKPEMSAQDILKIHQEKLNGSLII